MRKILPLSTNQQNIWSLEQKHPHASINNICETIYIEGLFDAQILNHALNTIVQSDASFLSETFGKMRKVQDVMAYFEDKGLS